METITIQVEDNKVMAGLKKVLKSMRGVAIIKNEKAKLSGIEEADEDIRCGRTKEFDSSEELFKSLDI